jgi:UDP-2,4-diacetamido-2,4,6-trideoxy-beta-L-altropyranose hydrolase
MKVLFRADAGVKIGMGHIMRCLALAQTLQDTGTNAFVINSPANQIEETLRKNSMSVFQIRANTGSDEDIDITVKCAETFNADWLVLDGYHFGPNYQKKLQENGLNTLLIDDVGDDGPDATDIILNQNIYADETFYADRRSESVLLLGCKYVILRKEFFVWREWAREIPSIVRRILVTIGGSDNDNVTAKVIDALNLIKIKDIEITVVAGQLNPNYQKLSNKIARLNMSISLKKNLDNLAPLIADADLVISGGGSTCYELAFMGAPFTTIVIAENQVEIANHLSDMKICANLGWFHSLSAEIIADRIEELIENRQSRYEMSCNGKNLVDGYGVDRVVKALIHYRTRRAI